MFPPSKAPYHSIRISAFSIRAREALSQHIARLPLSLRKISIEQNGDATAISFSEWPDKPHVVRLAPAGWKKQQQQADRDPQPYDVEEADSVSDKESRSTWARLIAQVYEVDPLVCPRCSAPMRILAVITEPEEVRKILRHLVKSGRSRMSSVSAARRSIADHKFAYQFPCGSARSARERMVFCPSSRREDREGLRWACSLHLNVRS
jgi:hypothetical protein